MKFNAFPVVRYLLYLIAGIVIYFYTHYFHTTFYYVAIAVLVAFLGSIYLKKPLLRGALGLLLFVLSGWIIAFRSTAINQDSHFINHGGFSYYQAIISSNIETKAKTYKAEAEIKAIKTPEGWLPSTGKVLLYFNKDAHQKPEYGDIFLIKNQPQAVEPPKNPAEFDYRRYLENKGIYAYHFLPEATYLRLGHAPASAILAFAYKANHYADSVFKTRLKTVHEYAITNAMVVGTRDDIDNELLDAYSASGAIHVLSVSGMHVAILFGVISFLLAFLKKRGKYGSWIFMGLVLVILWAYAVFTGLSATVLRATVVFSFIEIGRTFFRRHNIYNTLALSAFLLLCWNPYWLLDVGFQLSYLAIIGIVYLHPYLNQLVNPTNPLIRIIWEGTVVCFTAQLFTFLLSIYYFHQFPTYFLIANPFVALFSFAILPVGLALLVFAAIPVVADVLAWVLKLSCLCLNETTRLIEKLPLSTLKGFSISIPELLVWYVILFLIIAFFLRIEHKYLKLAALLITGLALLNIYEDYRQSHQKELTFHYLPQQGGISIIDGKSATFLADSGVINDKKAYSFRIKNYYDQQGVLNQYKLPLSTYRNQQGITLLDFEGKRIVWLQKSFRGKLQGKADFVLLSNNALRNLQNLSANFQAGLIILDGSNKRYLVEKLRHQADSLHLNLIALQDTGAYTVVAR
ncbi:ComEC/Rec2 family competence protein [Emticicia sp. 17c]|uniref:ComEC/Rec2 family competence protein n=1 Tax=Emticicia sp. 17c TaxID=3127704 RepID=UPI00301D8AC6